MKDLGMLVAIFLCALIVIGFGVHHVTTGDYVEAVLDIVVGCCFAIVTWNALRTCWDVETDKAKQWEK